MTRSTRGRLAMIAVLATLAGGCDSFLDVNTDPNNPVNARVDLRLPALITGFGHSVYYGDTQLWGAEWTQSYNYLSDTRYYAEVQHYELQENDPTHAWNFYFTEVLNEARLMMEDTDKDKDPAYYGLAEFIWAWSWAHVTDMWGPVPYTEAFDPNIPAPKYDDQQTVYAGVYTSLDDAISLMGMSGGRRPAANDLLFAGDMAHWVKLANHLKATLELRLAYAPGEDANAHAQAALSALQAGLLSNADDADFTYPGGDNARNPLYTFQELRQWFGASEFMVNLTQSRNDPRIPILFRPAIKDSLAGSIVYRGHAAGAPLEEDSTISEIGHWFTNEDASLNWASYSDAKFTEAEARLIASGAAAADAPYRAGIRANMEKLGVASADIDTYLAGRPSLSSVANPLEEIITEKYIANYLKVDTWNDWRRTGYPVLQIAQGAILPAIPQRIRTPSSELSNNHDNAVATGIDPGLQGMLTEVWWASGSPPAAVTGGN